MLQHAATMTERPVPGLKIWWVIVGRLLASVFLLTLSSSLSTSWSFGHPPGEFLPISASVFALSAVYILLTRLWSNVEGQIRLQLFIDVILTTWLVWMTGSAHSPYVAVYIVIIALAGVYLGARDALVTSIGCAICYTSLTLAVVLHLILRFGGDPVESTPAAETIQKIGLNNIAFFVVGLLAARLAERQSKSDVQLAAATHALANLRALHERIIESMRSGVITTDLAGHIYSLNPAAEEITGYSSAELQGRPASLLFADLGELTEASLQATGAGEAKPRAQGECLKPNGTRLYLGYSVVPLVAESGEATGFVITFQDLTGVRALEERGRRQDRLAAVGRVAAGIAHEIRNPLAAMSGSIQVLKSELEDDPGAAELMEIVLRESERLNRIITDFLTYARPRPLRFVNTDLREPLRETLALLRNSTEIRRGHRIVEELPAAPLRAQADPAQLRQVFWNLARNALQAMPDGGSLLVSLARTPTGAAQIVFTDEGCGISPEQRENLFEPFSSTKPHGTGLGLSIVYQIIQDHRGTIDVQSRVGEGTTITVELPGEEADRHLQHHA